MPVYLLNANNDIEKGAAIERRIKASMPDLIRIMSLDEVTRGNSVESSQQKYVLLTGDVRGGQDFTKILETISRNRGSIFFIVISDEISVTDYKRLVRTGSADWVSASADPQEMFDVISRQRGGIQATPARSSEPIVVSFVPSAGGVGNTTFAVETSILLRTNKATAGRRICIVDLDFQSSHVCDYLDIEPRLQIQEIASSPERLDDQLFNIFISSHSSGLDVFAAPRSKFDFCSMNVSALHKLFDMISTRYDLIMIDLPVTWFAWTFQIIAGSDGVVVSGINTIPGLRQMAETVVTVRDACRTSCQVAVAVNRCEHGLMGGIVRRHHIEKVLGRENVFCVRNDSAMIQSVNSGTPMAVTNPARKVSKGIAALGVFCANLKSSRIPQT